MYCIFKRSFLNIGVTAILSTIKSSEVTIIKTVKTPPSCVKLVFGAMCVLVGVTPEKVTEAQAKKNVTIDFREKYDRNPMEKLGIDTFFPHH